MRVRGLGLLLATVAATVPIATAIAQGMFMNPLEERAEGVWRYPQEIAKHHGLYPNQALQDLLKRVGMNAAQATAKHPDQFVFSLVNDPEFNAYTTPGGFVYVERGILLFMNDGAELSALIGHEVGHAIFRHDSKAYARRQVGGRVAMALSQFGKYRGREDELAAGLKTKLSLYSQENEFQADDNAVTVSQKTGYDPYGATRMLLSLQLHAKAMTATTGMVDVRQPYELDHPYHIDRIRRSLQVAEAAARSMTVMKTNCDAFLALLDGLAVGPDTSTGGRLMHLRVVRIKASDTVQSLGTRMACPKAKVAWFMAINGFVTPDHLKPGMSVKLIV